MLRPSRFLPFAACLSLCGPVIAAGAAPSRDAAHRVEAALGPLPGAAAVGVLREGRIEVVVGRRERAGAPLETLDVRSVPGDEPLFEVGSISKVAERIDGENTITALRPASK